MELINYDMLKVGSARLELAPEMKPVAQEKTDDKGLSFKELMGGMVNDVDLLQKDADTAVSDLVSGKRNDIHNVAIKMDEAGVAFDLMLQIRNKMVEGFNELSKMQA